MQTAREFDLVQVELDARMEKFLEEFIKSFMGDRMGGMNGEIYMEGGRQPVRSGEAVQYDQFGNTGS
jgi:hypothetical protein